MPVTVRFDGRVYSAQEQIIQDATSSQDGVMSAAQAAALSQSLTTSAVNVYVDAVNGSDANPGTQSQPFATLEKAIDIANGHSQSYIINVVGTVRITSPILFLSTPYGANAVPPIIVGGQTNLYGNRTTTAASANGSVVTDATLTQIRTNAAASVVAGAGANKMRILVPGYTAADVGSFVQVSGSASPINNYDCFQIIAVNPGVSIDVMAPGAVIPDAGPLTVTDSLVGGSLTCISGVNVGQRRMIRSNTTTSFTTNTPFNAAISIGDVFMISRPSGVLQYQGTLTWVGQAVGFSGIKFKNVAPTTAQVGPMGFNTEQCLFESCEMDFATLDGNDVIASVNFIDGAQAFAGQFNAPQLRNWGNDTSGLFTSPAKRGSGLFVHNGSGVQTPGNGFEFNQGARINGFYVLRMIAMNLDDGSSGNLKSLDAARVSSSIQASCELIHTAQVATFPSKWTRQYTSDVNNGLMTFLGNCSGSIDGIDMSNSGGDALLVTRMSTLQVNKVTGTGNAGAGLHVDRTAYIQIDSGGANNTTVTGAVDGKLGHASPANTVTYAQIRTTDGNGVKGQQDTYGNRIET